MLDIEQLKQKEANILCIGSHNGIIQSILDFDFHAGKKKPSIVAIIAGGRKYERYFFGKREILIPVFSSVLHVPKSKSSEINLFLSLTSARRVLSSTVEVLNAVPGILGGVVFAENVPEKHSLDLKAFAQAKQVFIIGPASVGLVIPEFLKIGAIGGTQSRQLVEAQLFEKGSVAVFSASGGMTNEIINIVTSFGKRISFSLSFGGDRFPITNPKDAFLAAEKDSNTKAIIYYGELGGSDEYALAELISTKKVTKPVVAYIAGVVAEIFPQAPQFGHAKAMASTQKETARAKREILKNVGVQVGESFGEFVELIKKLPDEVNNSSKKDIIERMEDRKHALIATSISKDLDGKVMVLGEELLSFATGHTFGYIVASMFLGKKIKSTEFEKFVDFVLRLLVDHGPYMSGAVNTIVTARAGRDLVSSLASGILTIGPRFGGAINEAAGNWLKGVSGEVGPAQFVEEFAASKKYISGIGHKKYRVDLPDPRVAVITDFAKGIDGKFTKFARAVEKETVAKKGNLILNVDGAIAAVALDILSEKEELSDKELAHLVDIEFFNALFVLSRSVGFISHFLDQKRLDEGLFRLEEEHVADATE
jgi:ATP citrate (pro-S)-lyase